MWSIICADARRREPAAHEPALARVLGIVDRHDRQVAGAAALRADALRAAEQLGLAFDVGDVVVLRDHPEVVAFVPVHGIVARAASRRRRARHRARTAWGRARRARSRVRGRSCDSIPGCLQSGRARTTKHEFLARARRARRGGRRAAEGARPARRTSAWRSARTTTGSCSAGHRATASRIQVPSARLERVARCRAAAGARRRRRGSPRRAARATGRRPRSCSTNRWSSSAPRRSSTVPAQPSGNGEPSALSEPAGARSRPGKGRAWTGSSGTASPRCRPLAAATARMLVPLAPLAAMRPSVASRMRVPLVCSCVGSTRSNVRLGQATQQAVCSTHHEC